MLNQVRMALDHPIVDLGDILTLLTLIGMPLAGTVTASDDEIPF